MEAPLWFRKLIVDFAETALGMVFALQLIFPGSLDEAQAAGAVVGSAVIAALVSAARRAIPGFVVWLSRTLNVPEDDQGNG